MKIDRFLLPVSVLLLLLQLVWLSQDLGLISAVNFSNKKNLSSSPTLGKIIRTHNKVRLKSQAEIIWNEANQGQDLKAFDALLTLSESSTQIQLANGSQLNLSENTLVHLEPMGQDTNDGRIRIRFSRGQALAQTRDSSDVIETQTWILSPDANTEANIKLNDAGDIKVEVSKGLLRANSAEQEIQIGQGELVQMHEHSGVVQKFVVSQFLRWASVSSMCGSSSAAKATSRSSQPLRLYAHVFPCPIKLSWEGTPDTLVVTSTTGERKIPLKSNSVLDLAFERDSFELQLRSKNSVSDWLKLQVWQAPKIHLLLPLPRDRFAVEDQLTFIWTRPKGVSSFQWQLGGEEQNLNVETKGTLLERQAELPGPYLWQVMGTDNEGFFVPPLYDSPLYIENSPLSPPKLKPAIIRKPASPAPKPKPRSSLFQLIIGQLAFAEALDQSVLFSWERVDQARFYVIEISSDPYFRNLLHQGKSTRTEYSWPLPVELQEFYWRVAAGNENQKGKFSESRQVKLSEIKKESREGVSLISQVKEPVEVKSEPKEANVVKQAASAVEETSIGGEPTPQVQEYQIGQSSQLRFLYSYEMQRLEDNQGSSYTFTGTMPGLRFDLESNQEHRSYRYGFEIENAHWVSSSDAVHEGSRTLRDLRIAVFGYLAKPGSPWFLGTKIRTAAFPQRESLEGLSFRSELFFGLSSIYRQGPSQVLLNAEFSGRAQLAEIAWSYQFFRWQKLRADFTLSTSYLNTSWSVKGLTPAATVGLGIDW